MWLDACGLALLLIFGWLGFRRGSLDGAFRLFSLLAAYATALWAAPRWAGSLAEVAVLPRLIAGPLVGVVAFLFAFAFLGAVGAGLRAWERRSGETKRSEGDRAFGAALGIVRGGILVVLIGWAALWMDALQAVGSGPSLPETSESVLAGVSERLVESGAEALLDSEAPGGRMTTEMLARPRRTVEGVQRVLEHPSIHALAEDSFFLSDLEAGAIDHAMNLPSFQRVSRDEELRREFENLGLVPPGASEDSLAFRAEARGVLEEVGSRIRGLSDDPEVQSLARDPRVREAIESGRTDLLLRHPGFRSIVDRVSGAGG